MESLLVNVSKYAASHQTSPIENFITEAFAWLLKYDDAVRKTVNDLLILKSEQKSLVFHSLCHSDDIETQVNFSGKYPDLLWNAVDNAFCAIFEHKVWSELHINQLDNYRQYAQSHLNKPFVIVLITAHAGQHRQSPDIALCWHEIADVIGKLEPCDDKSMWLRNEFINLLKNNGLVNSTPINPLAVAYYNDVKNIDKQLYEMVQRSVECPWPLYHADIPFHYPAKHRSNRNSKIYEEWGRIGLEFASTIGDNNESGWLPGVFCGFMVDSHDHITDDLLEHGPVAIFILSVDKSIQHRLKLSGCYDRLVEEISVALPEGWQLSDRTTMGHRYNAWHPVMIYRNLTNFLAGANTADQQTSVYFEQMSELQKLFLDSSAFSEFCREIQK